MLNLENEFGIEIEIKELKDKKEKVNNMVQINITGHGNTVNTGNEAHLNIQQETKVQQNDIISLKDVLKEMRLDEEAIKEIAVIVKEESPTQEGDLGNKAQLWLNQIGNKIVKGIVTLASGVTLEVIKKALLQYWGL